MVVSKNRMTKNAANAMNHFITGVILKIKCGLVLLKLMQRSFAHISKLRKIRSEPTGKDQINEM